ncbi:NUDIX domain-containing protein [Streptomyces sp. ST2-7A]|uniref:NUDIX domain-containing protein n=1 Tax=Streptomyces sp. ST2-7A TaxID=2907214 RepID=UPI001F46F4B7|nr:NUDIX hydrolase [Streptomyces sp. ST2-7A]MCE7081469.1 NUDIX hydrolase [Streptomyces sp. ST2-7A]
MTDAPSVVKRTARAILLDTGPPGCGERPRAPEMIVIKRTKPGMAPYWITPGGGVEPGDATVLDALHREVFEELGAKVTDVVPAFVDTVPIGPADGHEALRAAGPHAVKVQHFFVCRPASIDPSLRHGPEVDEPCGEYETVRLPFTRAGLSSVNLVPETLYRYLMRNIPGVLSLLAPDLR